jgi:hypothetical protein
LSREVEEGELAPDDQNLHKTFKKGMKHCVKYVMLHSSKPCEISLEYLLDGLGKERECSPLALCKTWLHPEKLATFTF